MVGQAGRCETCAYWAVKSEIEGWQTRECHKLRSLAAFEMSDVIRVDTADPWDTGWLCTPPLFGCTLWKRRAGMIAMTCHHSPDSLDEYGQCTACRDGGYDR